jgi:pantoate--beta-alanine ligase
MDLITSLAEMKAFSRQARSEGRKLALVPTMGALHKGHLSLVERAEEECDAVVVSIFVNPTQFSFEEDFARYPRDLAGDIATLEPLRIDVLFSPSGVDMYPRGFETFVEPGSVASSLEGAYRPGHFRGVATVVIKLFNIVAPDVAYFGQKDFQQTLVVQRLIEDLNLDVRLAVCPIAREPDGLARSSRNAYLSPSERQAASVLHRSLRRAEELFGAGETKAGRILEEMHRVLGTEPWAKVDYVAVVEPTRLQPVALITPGSVALVAARIGAVRLLDNTVLGLAGEHDDPGAGSPKLQINPTRATGLAS